jgi:(R)-2-hydroxyacyl-CoA dehydratese activating ATPase
MGYFMGIDIGSGTSKGMITENGKVMAYDLLDSGFNYRMAAQKLRESLLKVVNLKAENISRTISTGHGDGLIPFSDKHIAGTQCCAKGINHIYPSVRTVIDVQGHSSEIIKLDEEGKVINFIVSEICATGSGRFIDVITNVLQLERKDVGPLSLQSKNPVHFTTGCAVFGESEAISRVAEGAAKEDILAGIHKSIAGKILSLMDRIGLEEECAISGGGALNVGLIKSIEDQGVRLLVPSRPQFVNALGAAIMAGEENKEKGRDDV